MKTTAKLWLIILCIAFCFSLCACSAPSFSDMVIYAEDKVDVPEGDYNLEYSVKDYETFKKLYGLKIDVKVFDENGNSVAVANNRTIKAEKSKIYTVNLICSATVNGEIKERIKKFTVVTEKKDPTVYFYTGKVLWRTVPVTYGGTLDIADVPEIPDHFPTAEEGYNVTITAKRWTVTVGGVVYDLTQAHLSDLTSDVTVVGDYTYDRKIKDVSIEYESNGGSVLDTDTVPFSQIVEKPADPTKAGFVFAGWYTDGALTKIFDWSYQKRVSLRANYKLYAKWLPDRHPESVGNFLFEKKTDNYGYDYYLIKFNGTLNEAGSLYLPDAKDNIPVRGFKAGAFADSAIKSVAIPAHYDMDTYEAFRGCTELESVVFETGCLLSSLEQSVFEGCASLTKITVPEGVTKIDVAAFLNCTALKEITLPSTLTRINERAFKNCTALISVTIPEKTTAILQEAFFGCSSLTTVIFHEKSELTFLPKGVFNGTAITSITLPYSCKTNSVNPFDEGSGVSVGYFPKPAE